MQERDHLLVLLWCLMFKNRLLLVPFCFDVYIHTIILRTLITLRCNNKNNKRHRKVLYIKSGTSTLTLAM
jgi:hypothetical protein